MTNFKMRHFFVLGIRSFAGREPRQKVPPPCATKVKKIYVFPTSHAIRHLNLENTQLENCILYSKKKFLFWRSGWFTCVYYINVWGTTNPPSTLSYALLSLRVRRTELQVAAACIYTTPFSHFFLNAKTWIETSVWCIYFQQNKKKFLMIFLFFFF